MPTIKAVNIKCGGCEQEIKSELEKIGLKDVRVDPAAGMISFAGDRELAAARLNELGYPEAGTPAAASLMKKGMSYVSCLRGRRQRWQKK